MRHLTERIADHPVNRAARNDSKIANFAQFPEDAINRPEGPGFSVAVTLQIGVVAAQACDVDENKIVKRGSECARDRFSRSHDHIGTRELLSLLASDIESTGRCAYA